MIMHFSACARAMYITIDIRIPRPRAVAAEALCGRAHHGMAVMTAAYVHVRVS